MKTINLYGHLYYVHLPHGFLRYVYLQYGRRSTYTYSTYSQGI